MAYPKGMSRAYDALGNSSRTFLIKVFRAAVRAHVAVPSSEVDGGTGELGEEYVFACVFFFRIGIFRLKNY